MISVRYQYAILLLAISAAAFSADKNAERIQFVPDTLPWKLGPASLPAGAEMAMLEGNPKARGLFTMRVRLPAGTRLQPHWHPKPERVTVLEGMIGIGLGSTFDEKQLKQFPAGSYYVTPPRAHHYAVCTAECVLQVTTMGPWELHYLEARP